MINESKCNLMEVVESVPITNCASLPLKWNLRMNFSKGWPIAADDTRLMIHDSLSVFLLIVSASLFTSGECIFITGKNNQVMLNKGKQVLLIIIQKYKQK